MKGCLFVFLFIFSGCFLTLSAQSKFYRATIGFSAGTTQYNGEVNNDFYAFRTASPFSAINYSHYASSRCDIRLGVAFGSWGYSSATSNSFVVDFVNANLDVKLKLLARDNPRYSPYLFGGIGLNQFNGWALENRSGDAINTDSQGRYINANDLQEWSGILSAGAGLQIRLAERVFFHFEERLLFPNTDAVDGIIIGPKDMMLRHTAGIAFGLFPWRDTDRDGISDKADRCPSTPAIAAVDAFGCPIDSDMDGIADFEDACLEMPGVLSGNGCPDADGDGIIDNLDSCPTEIGLAAFQGCPDRDGDGIRDLDDSCPDIAGLIRFKGCVDSDKDEIPDPTDRCPNTPASVQVDAVGCPLDGDGDEVPDYLDACPDLVGLPGTQGCPEVKAEVRELFERALNGIKFETGKDIIKKESFAILDTVVQVLRENPTYQLRIFGHTDNVGDPEKNLKLSQMRADAVAQFIVQKGLAGRVAEIKGFGDQKPVADNTTKEGRMLNRRVAFEVVF